jgi:diguanylate cyclase (GGDEF)-like protein
MRILIADDDPTSRLLLATIAGRQGHECVLAEDGSTAWHLLRHGSIEVLLTDWMMPGLDGPELCRQVREEVTDRYVYVVLITGLGDRHQILEGMSAGADDYLVKPVDPFSLQTRLVAAERVTTLHRQVAHFRAELERANLKLLGQSLTDPLTGLGNRRRMEQDLAQAHAWAQRKARSYAICLFDIDHFKLYNDHYGHPAGDEALRTVAGCLGANVRATDRAYRYGGEEFLVVMPDCDLAQAATLARRAGQAVLDRAIPHAVRPSTPTFITLSAGIAVGCGQPGQTTSDVIAQADRALYRAKSRGRNQVSIGATGQPAMGR